VVEEQVQVVVPLLHQMEATHLLDLLQQSLAAAVQVVVGQVLVMVQMDLLVVLVAVVVVLGLAAVHQHKEQVEQQPAVKVMLVVMVHQLQALLQMLQVAVAVEQVL
jgi:hypothetical protein